MAGTTYNTLNLVVEDEPKQETGSRKVAIIAAVVVACCAMFFAGRTAMKPVGYTHEEVINTGAICEEGQYIGGCKACKECASYEYDNGGCTFFKDTKCDYCEPIPNCKREETSCTNRIDQTCGTCDCTDPISSWADKPKEQARAGDSTFSCYIGEQCTPCEPCRKGYFETKACDPATNSPTECQRCKTCDAGTFVSSVCSYTSDTECAECSTCDALGALKTEDVQCTGDARRGDGINDIFTQGFDTVCKDCLVCNAFSHVEEACTSITDTKCKTCSDCEDGEYIFTECLKTDSPTAAGQDTNCATCKELVDPTNAFITTDCDPLGGFDYAWTDCTECVNGEYILGACTFGDADNLGVNRVCEDCAAIPDCAGENMCSNAGDQTCSRCGEPGVDAVEGRDDVYFNTWKTCCGARGLGSQCEWVFHDAGCDEGQKNFMERTAKRAGFNGETGADFVLWCKMLCEENAGCNAFEVASELADNSATPTAGSICGLKNHENYDFGSGTAAHSCWSKRPAAPMADFVTA